MDIGEEIFYVTWLGYGLKNGLGYGLGRGFGYSKFVVLLLGVEVICRARVGCRALVPEPF